MPAKRSDIDRQWRLVRIGERAGLHDIRRRTVERLDDDASLFRQFAKLRHRNDLPNGVAVYGLQQLVVAPPGASVNVKPRPRTSASAVERGSRVAKVVSTTPPPRR